MTRGSDLEEGREEEKGGGGLVDGFGEKCGGECEEQEDGGQGPEGRLEDTVGKPSCEECEEAAEGVGKAHGEAVVDGKGGQVESEKGEGEGGRRWPAEGARANVKGKSEEKGEKEGKETGQEEVVDGFEAAEDREDEPAREGTPVTDVFIPEWVERTGNGFLEGGVVIGMAKLSKREGCVGKAEGEEKEEGVAEEGKRIVVARGHRGVFFRGFYP